MKKQVSMSFFDDELATIQTSKKEFLAKMNNLIPWQEWVEIVRPHYYENKTGNAPYDIELMLRIFALQNLYDMADMRVMTEVIDSRAFSEFCDVESSNQIPNGDTIGRFRNILFKNKLAEQFFAQVYAMLEQQGLVLKKGTIVDSTIIAAPSSTKNRERKRDEEAGSTKKGKSWKFGYKAHIGADKGTKIVHTVEVTPANVHDITVAEKLLHGEEETCHGDAGYLGIQKRIPKNIKFKINRRPSSIRNTKKFNTRQIAQLKRREKEKSSVRCAVEHIFGVVKGLFGYRKTRYKGLAKQTQKVNMVFALSNLWLSTKISINT